MAKTSIALSRSKIQSPIKNSGIAKKTEGISDSSELQGLGSICRSCWDYFRTLGDSKIWLFQQTQWNKSFRAFILDLHLGNRALILWLHKYTRYSIVLSQGFQQYREKARFRGPYSKTVFFTLVIFWRVKRLEGVTKVWRPVELFWII